jgi:hypothetical protein
MDLDHAWGDAVTALNHVLGGVDEGPAALQPLILS